MASYGYIMLAVGLLLTSIFMGGEITAQGKINTNIIIEQQARSMAAYIDSAAEYKQANPTSSGDITNKLALPTWLASRTDIHVYAEGNKFFIYTPDKPGSLTAMRKLAYNSSTLGRAANSVITLSDGNIISKPSAIPNGTLVFIL